MNDNNTAFLNYLDNNKSKCTNAVNTQNNIIGNILLYLFSNPYSTEENLLQGLKIDKNMLKYALYVMYETYGLIDYNGLKDSVKYIKHYYIHSNYFKQIKCLIVKGDYQKIFTIIDTDNNDIGAEPLETDKESISLNEHKETLASNISEIIKILDDLPAKLNVDYEIHKNILKGSIKVKIFQHDGNKKLVSFSGIKLEIFQDKGNLQYKIKSGKEKVVLSDFEKVIEAVQFHFEMLIHLLSSLVNE